MDGSEVRRNRLCMKNNYLKYLICLIMSGECSCSNNIEPVSLDGQLIVNVKSRRNDSNELDISRDNPLQVEVAGILGRDIDILDKWPKTNIWVEVLSENMMPIQKMAGRVLLDPGKSLFPDKEDRSFMLMLADIEDESLIIRKETNPFFGFYVERKKNYKILVRFEGYNRRDLCVFKASSMPMLIRVK